MTDIWEKKNLSKSEKTLINAYVNYARDEKFTSCNNAQEMAKEIRKITGNYNTTFYTKVVLHIDCILWKAKQPYSEAVYD